MDFNKMPRIICTETHINNNDKFFFLGFSSGTLESSFMLEPAMAKSLRNMLDERVRLYEEQHGEIDLRDTRTGIASPIQPN